MKGGERHPAFSYPDEEYRYFIFADRFGWTPAEVDEQPAALLDWLMAISVIQSEVEQEKNAS
jgi:hypothetical protein